MLVKLGAPFSPLKFYVLYFKNKLNMLVSKLRL